MEDPLWYKDAVIYQLHLKSFFDGNNDGVGDFRGLMEKLDYIAELGVTAIWMLPFYPSPRRDDGYDIADYTGVHAGLRHAGRRPPLHRGGARTRPAVITELVINHTSTSTPGSRRARRAPPGSPERDFYVWSDTDDEVRRHPDHLPRHRESNWTWDAVAGAYYWHRFYSHQPDLNFDNPAVLEEVFKVMRFWLDLGVDGLRLDAVPYLIEREGTNNENLAETHDILKKIRAEMDRYAPGRMLLAEANQWPEDAQQYFGDGDECHMSFHFPLMPRMYMAIAREDRFPITDIMRQTPAIPENCQWAVFLRNHDELTLEMVTSGERDYLWDTYAADRRARINLGIRRRLAPLLERDRRRIELMNGLLLSMPGTPVIYYGDEIGMGDNIFLGDRDGVRTPMQWSVDRNGGFSRADPAQHGAAADHGPDLRLPGRQRGGAGRDPHSLLNWTRRMLAVRKRHRPSAAAPSASSTRQPQGPRLPARARWRTAPETHPLRQQPVPHRAGGRARPVAFAGRVPVDIVGGSVFPPVGQLTYLLTLPPYGFYLVPAGRRRAAAGLARAAPEPLPEYATLVLRAGRLDDAARRSRAGDRARGAAGLPAEAALVRLQGRALGAVRVAYAVPLPGAEGACCSPRSRRPCGGRTERYVLPLGMAWEDETAAPCLSSWRWPGVRKGPRVGYLTDAFAVDALTRGMIDGLRDSRVMPIDDGELQFRPTVLMATIESAGRRDPPPVGRAVQLVLDRRRHAGAEAGPPRAGRRPPGR